MTGWQSWLAHILVVFPYPFLLPLIGAFIGGEETIIIISALSAGGFLPFPVVIIFSFIGTMLSDWAWFLFGKYFIVFLEKRPRIERGIQTVSAFINRVGGRRYFMGLLITKFLYGTRIIMLFYLGRERLSLLTFTRYNSIATALWVVTICSIGWFAGLGIINIVNTFGSVSLGVGLFVIIVGVIYSVRIWLNRIIIEDKKQL